MKAKYDLAKELKEKFIKETKGYTIKDVEKIWTDFSNDICAGWLITNKKGVEYAFKYLYKKEGSKIWKLIDNGEEIYGK